MKKKQKPKTPFKLQLIFHILPIITNILTEIRSKQNNNLLNQTVLYLKSKSFHANLIQHEGVMFVLPGVRRVDTIGKGVRSLIAKVN